MLWWNVTWRQGEPTLYPHVTVHIRPLVLDKSIHYWLRGHANNWIHSNWHWISTLQPSVLILLSGRFQSIFFERYSKSFVKSSTGWRAMKEPFFSVQFSSLKKHRPGHAGPVWTIPVTPKRLPQGLWTMCIPELWYFNSNKPLTLSDMTLICTLRANDNCGHLLPSHGIRTPSHRFSYSRNSFLAWHCSFPHWTRNHKSSR